MMRRFLLAAALVAALPAAPARADVCVHHDAGFTCAGPAGGRTTVTVQAGCCVFIESTGPIVLGRTGVQGGGLLTRSWVITLWSNWTRPAVVTVTPEVVTLRLEVGSQAFYVRNHIGCCVELDATGPMTLERTGLFGGEDLILWWNGRRVILCYEPVERLRAGDRSCAIMRPA